MKTFKSKRQEEQGVSLPVCYNKAWAGRTLFNLFESLPELDLSEKQISMMNIFKVSQEKADDNLIYFYLWVYW